MKAIILAAGIGSRISNKINNIPKSTLELKDGTPIIRRMVKNMLEFDIIPIICVGYQKEKIYSALEGLNVKYYINPFYSVTNNIASLWFARDEFDNNDILLTSADLYYPKDFLKWMLDSKADISMAVDSARINNGDFYFSVDKEGFICEYGPNTPQEKRNYEYMGLTKISKGIVHKVKEEIVENIEQGDFNKYFEDIIISMNIKKKFPIYFIDVKGNFWKEFDFYEDYKAILAYERDLKNG